MIEETIDGTIFQKERIVIDLNNLYKTTEELLVCVFNTNPSAEVISSIFNVEPITHYPNLSYIRTPDLPIAKKLKASEGIIAYRVKKEINEWNYYKALEPINKSEKEFIEFLDFKRRIIMTFNDFLKEEELNRDSLCNILMECANHNCELSKALSKAEVQKIPITILKQFIQAYQDSSVNLKTGKIISPAINLKTIKINQSQKATVTITCENLPRKRFVNAEIYLIALNRFHEYSFDIHRRSSVHAGFWLKENEIKEIKKINFLLPWKHCQKTQTFEINFSELASNVTEILVCAFVPQGFKFEKGNYNNFKITTNLWTGDSETPNTQELDITTKMSSFGGIHAFSLVKDINEWKTVPFDHILNGHPEEFMESLGKDLYHLNYD